MPEKLTERNIEDEMKESYLTYAMSVIVGRALPDVRDGLKPVQRRILYTMLEMGLRHNQPFKKCARIIGDVLGKYHPHGDMAVYEALVRMAQNFTMRYPLIEGQGNFGSIDGDPPAAMRYTEARLHRISDTILEDIDKETVNFVPNYDNSLLEPQVLPAKLPNLLINGSSGIAVGMATNIPPHNLSEVIDAIVAVIDEPDISPLELMKYLKGPDFPTAGIICGIEGIKDYFQTGKGIIKIRGRAKIEDIKGARKAIIITELPYQVNKSQLLERISELLKEGKIEDISNVRDESDKEGMRIVIESRRDADPEVILNQLYMFTQLEVSFGVILLALVDGQTKILNIVEIIQEYIKHRKDIIYKRTKFELQKAESRAHILEGFKLIIDNLNQVINLIRNSKDYDEASMKLIQRFNLTQRQTEAILQLRLHQLTRLEREKIESEYLELIKKIETYKSILANPKRILEIIKQEVREIKEKFGDKRLTEIQEVYIEKKREDIIKEEAVAVLLSSQGYVKRTPLNLYRLEERGKKGDIGMLKKEEDTITKIEATNTLSYLLLFSDKGRVHQIRVYELPEGSRSFKGKPLVNFIPLEKDEKITAWLTIDSFDKPGFLTMVTKNGTIKKTPLAEFLTSRKSIAAINLEGDDTLIDVKLTSGRDDIFISTRLGLAVRFPEKTLRPIGRNAKGVIAIKLTKTDSVIGCEVINLQNDLILIATEKGYGKITKAKEYRQQGRATKGVVGIRITDKNGPVVGIKKLSPNDDVLFVTEQGMTLRLHANSIPVYGRGTQGVKLLKLNENDRLISLTRIPLTE